MSSSADMWWPTSTTFPGVPVGDCDFMEMASSRSLGTSLLSIRCDSPNKNGLHDDGLDVIDRRDWMVFPNGCADCHKSSVDRVEIPTSMIESPLLERYSKSNAINVTLVVSRLSCKKSLSSNSRVAG